MESLFAALAAFGLVFLAEFGDRTQIILFGLAARHPRLPLFLGAACAFFIHTLVAVIIGDRLGTLMPTQIVLFVSAVVFLILGAFTLKNAIQGEAEEDERPTSGKGAFLTAFLFILLAELGDKTQIAAATMAAASGFPVATLMGAYVALLANAILALLVGRLIAKRLPVRTVRIISASAFLLAGLIMLWLALL